MKHHFGIALQVAAMTLLPLLIVLQLAFGFELLIMPTLTLVGIGVFLLGAWLRESS